MQAIESTDQANLPDEGTLTYDKGESLQFSNYKPLRYLKGNSEDKVLLVKNRSSEDLSVIKIHKKEEDDGQNTQLEQHLKEEIDVLVWQNKNLPFWAKFFGVISEKIFTGLVSEYIPGESLKSLAKRLGGMAPKEAKFYTSEILVALNYLHEQSIVHGRLNTDNVLIGEQGHIKLTNFCDASIAQFQEKYWQVYNKASEKKLINPYTEDWVSLSAITEEIVSPDKCPDDWESDACSLFIQLTNDSRTLLGENLIFHLWFQDLNWSSVRNLKYEPPYLPEIQTLEQLMSDLPTELIPNLAELGISE